MGLGRKEHEHTVPTGLSAGTRAGPGSGLLQSTAPQCPVFRAGRGQSPQTSQLTPMNTAQGHGHTTEPTLTPTQMDLRVTVLKMSNSQDPPTPNTHIWRRDGDGVRAAEVGPGYWESSGPSANKLIHK